MTINSKLLRTFTAFTLVALVCVTMSCSDKKTKPKTAPTITSTAPTTVAVGDCYTYSIMTTANPMPAILVVGLPEWLAFNGIDTISGTPTAGDAGATRTITIIASNGMDPFAVEMFSIQVHSAPTITSTAPTMVLVGMEYSYSITTSAYPAASLSVTDLPAWLAFDGVDLISGFPAAGDVGTTGAITVTADNGYDPDAEQIFTILVSATYISPTILSVAPTTATLGLEYSYEIIATGLPMPSISVTGLPTWLFFDGNNRIFGIPSTLNTGMTSIITVSVSNGASQNAVQVFSINVPLFTEIYTGIAGREKCSLAWGDYDNDGDLDLAMAGTYNTQIYRNDGGVFVDIGAGLSGVTQCSLAWGDYDNDGDLDIVIAGYSNTEGMMTRIYRNDVGVFTNINAGLIGIYIGSPAWGDYDNDGDLDIAITGGLNSFTTISRIYRNNAGAFVDINAGLMGVYMSSLAWGDYDNDGDLDLAIAGSDSYGYDIFRIYRNNSGSFADIGAGLEGFSMCSLAWGDYNNDGNLDIAILGNDESNLYRARVYRNYSGSFININAIFTGVIEGSISWGDYDNDGDLDLLIAGWEDWYNHICRSRLYRNDMTGFVEVNAGLTGLAACSLAWGDYDNDGDLDIAALGYSMGSESIFCLYRNDFGVVNTPPSAPINLTSTVNGTNVSVEWVSSTDAQTPTDGLNYNVRIGLTPGGNHILSGMSENFGTTTNGWRRIPKLGMVQDNGLSTVRLTINGLSNETYYWSVQAIDSSFAGSFWATEQTFTVR
ncbi:MAG: FG-GAP-like repeat-containing protein [Planctomycetota bacterium]